MMMCAYECCFLLLTTFLGDVPGTKQLIKAKQDKSAGSSVSVISPMSGSTLTGCDLSTVKSPTLPVDT